LCCAVALCCGFTVPLCSDLRVLCNSRSPVVHRGDEHLCVAKTLFCRFLHPPYRLLLVLYQATPEKIARAELRLRLRITTWNANSIRLREAALRRIVAEIRPDVLCLQETKVEDAAFPHELLAGLGFTHRHVHGQKAYHGVAILSRLPLELVLC